MSRDLETVHGWQEGDVIRLEGLGLFKVADRMHQRKRMSVDIFFFETHKAREFGRLEKVEAVRL